jgi:hypothetical protein
MEWTIGVNETDLHRRPERLEAKKKKKKSCCLLQKTLVVVVQQQLLLSGDK